jgi:hypothetical protein
MFRTLDVEAIDFRLLVPLSLDPRKVQRGDGLPRDAVVADDGWKYDFVLSPHQTYTEDFYPPVQGFLFSQIATAGSFACWQLEPDQARPWFEKTRVTIDSAGKFFAKISLRGNSGIEVFLSDLGVGLLSISLRLTEFPDLVWVRQLLHNLATAEEPASRNVYPVTLSRAARLVDLEKVPPEQRARVSRPPGRHDTLSERLVREGGVYDWNELRDYLLAPLTSGFGAQTIDRRAWCHTVLELGQSHDFQKAEDRRALKPILSALAQLHPKSHPGEVAGRTHGRYFTVNRTHIAAVSLTGAAHAIARQPSHTYDDLHLLRAHNTYFVAYLLASLQRLVLQQFLGEAQKSLSVPWGEIASGGGNSTDATPRQRGSAPPALVVEPRLLELRRAIVRFGLTGEQLEVSQRGTIQRFYGMARDASAVPSAFAQLRAVISEWDGIERAERLHETAQDLRKNVESLEHLQGEVGWVEVVIISVYVVQLAQIIGQGFGFPGSWWNGVSLLALSIFALALAWLCGFYPGKHKSESRWQKAVFVGMFALIGAYVVLNRFVLPAPEKPPSGNFPAASPKKGGVIVRPEPRALE